MRSSCFGWYSANLPGGNTSGNTSCGSSATGWYLSSRRLRLRLLARRPLEGVESTMAFALDCSASMASAPSTTCAQCVESQALSWTPPKKCTKPSWEGAPNRRPP